MEAPVNGSSARDKFGIYSRGVCTFTATSADDFPTFPAFNSVEIYPYNDTGDHAAILMDSAVSMLGGTLRY